MLDRTAVLALVVALAALTIWWVRYQHRYADCARQAREAQIGRAVAAYLERQGLGDTPPADTARSWARGEHD